MFLHAERRRIQAEASAKIHLSIAAGSIYLPVTLDGSYRSWYTEVLITARRDAFCKAGEDDGEQETHRHSQKTEEKIVSRKSLRRVQRDQLQAAADLGV